VAKLLVIENNFGEIVRTIPWDGSVQLTVIRYLESGRIEVTSDPQQFGEEGLDYQILGPFNKEIFETGGFKFGNGSRLKLVPKEGELEGKLDQNEPEQPESRRLWYRCLAIVSTTLFAFVGVLSFIPEMIPELEEELKEHVVKVVKRAPPPPRTIQIRAGSFDLRRAKTKITKKVSKKRNVSRLGALGVLGSLKKSKQRGGLNLGAAQTSAGIGRGGGTAGSGGVQTSLYGKGLVAAPLGEGGNIRGGGGYGTKGKGGGRAGYGKLTMIGSTGNNSIPLGTEAIIDGGLDRDAVARVMEAKKGQVLFCYEQGLQNDPSLAGRIALRFSIGFDGHVTSAGVASSTLNSKAVESCVLQRLKTWQFPIPKGGMEVKISYPYMLKRKRQG